MRDVQAASLLLLLLLKMAAAAGGQQRHQRTCPLSAYPALSKKSIVCKRKRSRHHHFTFLGLFEKRLRLLLPLLPKHTPPTLQKILGVFSVIWGRHSLGANSELAGFAAEKHSDFGP